MSLARREVAVVLCVLSGVVVLPGGLNAFTLPKLCVAAAATGVALAAGPTPRLGRPVTACLALGGVAVAVAVALSEHPWLALVGPEPRYPGLVSLLPYLGLGLAGAALLSRKEPRLLVGSLAVAAAAVTLVSVLEHAGLRPLESDVARPGSLLGNASDQGQWGLLALGPLLLVAVTRRTALPVLGALLAGAVVALSGSRAALLGELVMALAVALLRFRRSGWALAIAAPVVLALAALAVPGVAARVGGSSPLAQHTAHGRTLLWQETLSLVADHPLGVAPGGYLDAIPAEHDRRWALEVGPATPASSPESWPLELLAVGGPLLLLSGVALSALLLVAGWRRRDEPWAVGLVVGLIGYAVALAFAAVSPGPATLAALFGGALLAAPSTDEPRAGRWLLPWAFGVAALVLLLAAVAEIPLRSGLLDVQRGRLAAADDALRGTRALRPWDPGVAVQAGHAFAAVAQGGVRGAADLCERWLGTAPETLAVIEDRASCAETAGELPRAAALLAVASRRDPVNALLALRQGVVAAEQRDYQRAEPLFLRAASLAPTSPEPWRDLAQLYQLTGRGADRARALAEQAKRS